MAPETAPQRESMVLYFKYLEPPGPARICAPSRHRQMLAKIYANLGVPVEFLEPSGPTGFGEVAVHYDKATGVGTIRVNRIGVNTIAECYQGWQDLERIAGAAVIGLDLPLAQGGTPYLCDLAEENGFFFSGSGRTSPRTATSCASSTSMPNWTWSASGSFPPSPGNCWTIS